MKKLFASRKGFTIVELTIVIAVIAILAAVLIPTFVNLVNKANKSADVQMITNINKYLAALEVTEGKNTTMHEAVTDAKGAGYDVTKLMASNKTTILWNQETDRFLTVDGDKVIASSSEEGKEKNIEKSAKYWIVSAEAADEHYSVYYIGTETNITLTNGLGFDAGDKIVSVTYNTDKEAQINGVFQNLTVSGNGKPVVYGYVYKLADGSSVKTGGAVFHDNVKDRVEGNFIGPEHYDANNDRVCDFCNDNLCDHVMESKGGQDADCTRAGHTLSQCKNCQYIEYIVIPELGHDWQKLEAIPATCTETGQDNGYICLRCGEKDGGGIIMPLFHSFVDGKCERCKITEIEYHNGAITVTADDILNGTIDFKGLDKRKDLITVVLNSDIIVDADKFCEVFGTKEIVYWLKDDKEVGGTESITEACNGDGIYCVNMILNGYTLTVNSSRSALGIEAYGHFKVTGRPNLENQDQNVNAFVLNGTSKLYTSLIHATVGGSAVTFDGINMTADYYPIYAAYLTKSYIKDGKEVHCIPNEININNSTLKLRTGVSTTKGNTIKIYYDLTAVHANSARIDWSNTSNSTYGFAGTYKDGVITAYTGSSTTAQFSVKFYLFDENGNRVELVQSNYFSEKNAHFVGSDRDNSRFTIFDCEKDICDKDGNPVKILTGSNLQKQWVAHGEGFYDADTVAEVVKIENSPVEIVA